MRISPKTNRTVKLTIKRKMITYLLLIGLLLTVFGSLTYPKEKNSQNATTKYLEALNIRFVYIQPGSFMMGSPANEPGRDSDEVLHKVTLTKGFYLQTTEVTQKQWKTVMGNNPSSYRACGADCPVERVSWFDVQEFIAKLNQLEGTNTYRLPTEAEWEYACRAGNDKRYSWGDESACGQMKFANDSLTSCAKIVKGSDLAPNSTSRIKSYPPNAWGLYDMHGNVWEWCQDWFGPYPGGHVTDPVGAASGSYRVLRGGSWYSTAAYCRSAARYWRRPGDRYNRYGFRLAFSSPAGSTAENTYSVSASVKLDAKIMDSMWNGESIPPGQQCRRYGGRNPMTPRLLIKGIPPGTNIIIMEYSDKDFNPMDDGGHGKIGYRITPNTAEIVIPSVPGHTFDLPEGFLTVSPHTNPDWDTAGAYMPPCSGGSGHRYYVTVKAAYQSSADNREFKLLKWAVLELGSY